MRSAALRAVVVLGLATCGACRTEPNHPSPENAASAPSDAGLPTPPPSSRHGVIVPNDVGIGAGPSSPGGAVPSPNGSPPAPELNPLGGGH